MGKKDYPMELSKEQVHAILNEAEKKDEFDYVLFLTLATTGKRIGELYGVQRCKEIGRKVVGKKRFFNKGKGYNVDKTIPVIKKINKWVGGVRVRDIDLEKGEMRVWILKTEKRKEGEEERIKITGRQTPTLLPAKTLQKLRSFIRSNRLTAEDYVFRKEGRGYRQIQNKIKYYAKKAGIETETKREGVVYSLSIHSLRHHFITELKRKGLTNNEIIKLTGHKNEKTLSSYDHVISIDLKDKVMDILNEL